MIWIIRNVCNRQISKMPNVLKSDCSHWSQFGPNIVISFVLIVFYNVEKVCSIFTRRGRGKKNETNALLGEGLGTGKRYWPNLWCEAIVQITRRRTNHNVVRMTAEQFETILQLVTPHILKKQNPVMRPSISAEGDASLFSYRRKLSITPIFVSKSCCILEPKSTKSRIASPRRQKFLHHFPSTFLTSFSCLQKNWKTPNHLIVP